MYPCFILLLHTLLTCSYLTYTKLTSNDFEYIRTYIPLVIMDLLRPLKYVLKVAGLDVYIRTYLHLCMYADRIITCMYARTHVDVTLLTHSYI